jgi:hypothetical protein
MIVLTFDISRKETGYAVGEDEVEDSGSFSCKNLTDAEKNFNMLLRKWKPTTIAYAKATRFYNAQRAQARVEGVLMLCLEKYNSVAKKKTTLIDSIVDSSAKKVVLGTGKADKGMICEHFGTWNEDEADALMFFNYFLQEIKPTL